MNTAPRVWIWSSSDSPPQELRCTFVAEWQGVAPNGPDNVFALSDLSSVDDTTPFVACERVSSDDGVWSVVRACSVHQTAPGFVLVLASHETVLLEFPLVRSSWGLCVLFARATAGLNVERVQVGGSGPEPREETRAITPVLIFPNKLPSASFKFRGRILGSPTSGRAFFVRPSELAGVNSYRVVFCVANEDVSLPPSECECVFDGILWRAKMPIEPPDLDPKLVICNPGGPFLVSNAVVSVDVSDSLVEEGYVVINVPEKNVGSKTKDICCSVAALLNSSGGVIVLPPSPSELQIRPLLYGTKDVEFHEGSPTARLFGAVWVKKVESVTLLYVQGSTDHLWFSSNSEFAAWERVASPKPATERMSMRTYVDQFLKIPLTEIKNLYFSQSPGPKLSSFELQRYEFGRQYGEETLSHEWKQPDVLDDAILEAELKRGLVGMLNSGVAGQVGFGVADDGGLVGFRVLGEDQTSDIAQALLDRVRRTLTGCRPAFEYHVKVGPVCLHTADLLLVLSLRRGEVEGVINIAKKRVFPTSERLKFLLGDMLKKFPIGSKPLVLEERASSLLVGIFCPNKVVDKSFLSSIVLPSGVDYGNFTFKPCETKKCRVNDHCLWAIFVSVKKKSPQQSIKTPYVCEYPGTPWMVSLSQPCRISPGQLKGVKMDQSVYASRLSKESSTKDLNIWRRGICFMDVRYETVLLLSVARQGDIPAAVANLVEGPWSLVIALVTKVVELPFSGTNVTFSHVVTSARVNRQHWTNHCFGERDEHGEPERVLLLAPMESGTDMEHLRSVFRELPTNGRLLQLAVVSTSPDPFWTERLLNVSSLLFDTHRARSFWVGFPPTQNSEFTQNSELIVLDGLRIEDLGKDVKDRNKPSMILLDGTDLSGYRNPAWRVAWPKIEPLSKDQRREEALKFFRGAFPRSMLFLDGSVLLVRRLKVVTLSGRKAVQMNEVIDGVEELVKALEAGMEEGSHAVLNLWHEPCAGATTLANAALMRLRTKATCVELLRKFQMDERAEQLVRLFRSKEESRCCVLLDGPSEKDLTEFIDALTQVSSNQTQRIVLFVVRRVGRDWRNSLQLKKQERNFFLESNLNEEEQAALWKIYKNYDASAVNRLGDSSNQEWSSRLPHLALLAFGDASGELGSWGERVDALLESLEPRIADPVVFVMALFWLNRIKLTIGTFFSLCGLQPCDHELGLPLAANVLLLFSASGRVHPVHAKVAERIVDVSARTRQMHRSSLLVQLYTDFVPQLLCDVEGRDIFFEHLKWLKAEESMLRSVLCEHDDLVTALLLQLRKGLGRLSGVAAKWAFARISHLSANVFRSSWYRRLHPNDWVEKAYKVLSDITFTEMTKKYSSEVRNTSALVTRQEFIDKCRMSDAALLEDRSLSKDFRALLEIAARGWQVLRDDCQGIVSGSSQDMYERDHLNEQPPLTMYELAFTLYDEMKARGPGLEVEKLLASYSHCIDSTDEVDRMLAELPIVRSQNENYLRTLLPQSESGFGSRFAKYYAKFLELLAPMSLSDLANEVDRHDELSIKEAFRSLYCQRAVVELVPGVMLPLVLDRSLQFLNDNLTEKLKRPYPIFVPCTIQFLEFCLFHALKVPDTVSTTLINLLQIWKSKAHEAGITDIRPFVYSLALHCPHFEEKTRPWMFDAADRRAFEAAQVDLRKAGQKHGLTLVPRVCFDGTKEVPFLDYQRGQTEATRGPKPQTLQFRRTPGSDLEDLSVKPLLLRGKVQKIDDETKVLWGSTLIPLWGSVTAGQPITFSLMFGPFGIRAFGVSPSRRNKK